MGKEEVQMKKFKLRPEINEWKYWLHLVLISFIVLLILQLVKGGSMLTILNVLFGTLLIGISDVIVHSLLRLD